MTGEEARSRLDGAAFCIAHRLRYDPQLNVGCVVCQRAFAPPAAAAPGEARERRGFAAPVLLGVLLGLCGALALELSPLLLGPSRTASAAVAPQGLGAPPGFGSGSLELQPWKPALDEHVPPLPEGAPSAGLHGAAVRGDVPTMLKELQAHAAIDELDAQGLTPLLWALRANRPEAARLLIERGARVDPVGPSSPAPLLIAAGKGLESVTALLLERGADASAVDEDGMSALMQAARHDHAGVVRSLLARGTEIGRSDGMGRSALLHAAQGGASSELIGLLLDHGARLEARDIDGASALLLAAEQGHAGSVRALLQRGAELGARDQHGWSALDRVVQPRPGASKPLIAKLTATLELLIEHGIDARLTIDPASTQLLFRKQLENLYARQGLGPLPPYQPLAPARVSVAKKGARPSARPATLQLIAAINGFDREGHPASGTLIGYRGWTFVPERLSRTVLRNVGLYGDQRALLVGQADGMGDVHVADVLLLEVRENGRVVDRAFAGRPDGIEVDGSPVRRIGLRSPDQPPGAIDLTPWLAIDGRELVISVLSSYGAGSVSNVYLRVDGSEAQRVVARAEVERGGEGGAR